MFLFNFFWFILGTLPPALICVYPFWGHFKVSRKKLRLRIVLFLIYIVCTASVLEFFEFYSNSELRWLWPLASVFTLFVCFLFYFFTIKTEIFKLLYVFFITITYDNSLVSVSNFVPDSLFGHINQSIRELINLSLKALLLSVTLPFLLKFFRKYIKPIAQDKSSSAWKIMWVIPFIFDSIFNLFSGFYPSELITSWQYLIILVLLTAGSFIVYYVSVKMLEQTGKNAKLAQQITLQREHYKSLQTHIEETKRIQHDFRHQMSVILSYASSDKNKELMRYLSEYAESLPYDTEMRYCENFAINSIVCHYAGIAKSEGIEVSVCLELPKNIGVGDTDLCIIFGNCIENAIEACGRLKEGRFIKVNSALSGNMLVIGVDNSFDGMVKKEGENFLSLKGNDGGKAFREGLGISSVKAVAEKYGGSAKFEAEGYVFKATVILCVNLTGGRF